MSPRSLGYASAPSLSSTSSIESGAWIVVSHSGKFTGFVYQLPSLLRNAERILYLHHRRDSPPERARAIACHHNIVVRRIDRLRVIPHRLCRRDFPPETRTSFFLVFVVRSPASASESHPSPIVSPLSGTKSELHCRPLSIVHHRPRARHYCLLFTVV